MVSILLRLPCCRCRGDRGGESSSRAVQYSVTTQSKVRASHQSVAGSRVPSLILNELERNGRLRLPSACLTAALCFACQADSRSVRQLCRRKSEERNRTFPALCCSLFQLPYRSKPSRGALECCWSVTHKYCIIITHCTWWVMTSGLCSGSL